MKLPNAELAVIEIAKLRDYCLNPEHPRGRYKAHVFARVLGFTADDAEALREALLDAAQREEVALGEVDSFGQRYTLDCWVEGPTGGGMVLHGLDRPGGRGFSASDDVLRALKCQPFAPSSCSTSWP